MKDHERGVELNRERRGERSHFNADRIGVVTDVNRERRACDSEISLILPVNEWKAIRKIHFQMHVFRAIENGVPVVRGAASGLSAAIDPWGAC